MSCSKCNECNNSCTCPKAEVGERGFRGLQGIPGIDGIDGIDGQDGADSTVAGPPGTNGTNGIDGIDGDNGTIGIDGDDGADGLSAYEIWINAGNVGSEQDFLDSLEGPSGGGLTWIKTSPPDNGGANYNALPNHGYVSVNIGGGVAVSEFQLPLGTVVGDVVKIISEQGKVSVRPTSPQIVRYGTGEAGPFGFFPTIAEKFFMGGGETIQLIYMGDDNWIIDNFQTLELNPNLTTRIQ